MAIIKPAKSYPNTESAILAKFATYKEAGNGEIRVHCPTCLEKDRHKMKRYVNLQTGQSYCFICCKPMTFQDDFSFIGDSKLMRREAKIEHPMARSLPFNSAIPINQLEPTHPAIKFFEKDHLYNFDLYFEKYGICFVPYNDGKFIETKRGFEMKIGNCLIFPVFQEEELVGWQARFIPGHWYSDRLISKKLKYFHLYPKGEYLYNYSNCKDKDFVVVVEGIKKALKHPNCVATLGKGITDSQINILKEWPKVVLMLDGDDATQSIIDNLKLKLEYHRVEVKNINPADYGFPSPDEMTEEQLKQILGENI